MELSGGRAYKRERGRASSQLHCHTAGTVGLRDPAARVLYGRRAIRFLGSAISATTGFVTDSLTNSDVFPDISTLFLDDMVNDGSNASGSTSATAVYIFCLNLVLIL